jgi:CheY-like chemotaxis protein
MNLVQRLSCASNQLMEGPITHEAQLAAARKGTIMAVSKILIVEDELHHGQQLKQVLEQRGFSVLGPAPDCSAALELIWRERPDIAFVDTHLGSETCEAVLDECDLQDVPVIITSPDLADLPPFCGMRGRVNKPVGMLAVTDALAELGA